LLSRNLPESSVKHEHIRWDARSIESSWTNALEGSWALVNLAGRSVDCIKTLSHCDQILRSRVEATRVLGKALGLLQSPPKVWVQMSTAHIYGDPPKIWCTEGDAHGYGLAPTVGKAWEEAFHQAKLPNIKKVVLRTSFVLGKNKGALKRLEKLVRLGLGGTVGTGTQGMSWIHEQDMNRLFVKAIEENDFEGMYLATAPNPVSNKVFMKAMRKAMGVKIGLPAAKWMVEFGAKYILRTDPELGLYGRYCRSERLEEKGFEFSFPHIEQAFENLYQ